MMKRENGNILYIVLVTATMNPMSAAITGWARNPLWKQLVAIGIVIVLHALAVRIFRKYELGEDMKKRQRRGKIWGIFINYPLVFGLFLSLIGVVIHQLVSLLFDLIP
jgi:hypothetical protein